MNHPDNGLLPAALPERAAADAEPGTLNKTRLLFRVGRYMMYETTAAIL